MKIVLTGGGSGGHFNPLIAVAEEINLLVQERKLVPPQLYYFADKPYDEQALFENQIKFIKISAGKWRRYFSLQNFFDLWRTARGMWTALWKLYTLYPDVIFSKGGYVSFPVLWAARILRIPVAIHESDSHPGRVALWSGKFAARVALSFPEATPHFSVEKTAVTGNPIRASLKKPITTGAREYLQIDPEAPIIFITGGSQGAVTLNEAVLKILPDLVSRYAIIHQAGAENLAEVKSRSGLILENNPQAGRYQAYDYLNEVALKMVAGAATLAVSRAGAGMIFELANWQLPAILIPIPEAISHDQRSNAFTYARSGGAVVIEQENLTPSVLLAEIDRLVGDAHLREEMKRGAKSFARPEAGRLIAEALIGLALEHEE
ncbi:MAG: UDP-N-acetylglucosamine--N-acetylmuramyl-(pentapeptide) pyrophosphoryl-undecaprenol N-acetylglucosamine transferase [Patescibacteria group bacterium]